MSEQERIERLEVKTADLDRRVDVLAAKIDIYVEESRRSMAEFKTEMRDLQARTDARLAKMDEKIDSINKHINTMALAVVFGVGAMAVAVIVTTVFK